MEPTGKNTIWKISVRMQQTNHAICAHTVLPACLSVISIHIVAFLRKIIRNLIKFYFFINLHQKNKQLCNDSLFYFDVTLQQLHKYRFWISRMPIEMHNDCLFDICTVWMSVACSDVLGAVRVTIKTLSRYVREMFQKLSLHNFNLNFNFAIFVFCLSGRWQRVLDVCKLD